MEDWLEPLLDAETMRSVDAWAIEEHGTPSLELMEVAGRAVAEAALAIAAPGPARVVCGKGNNGGDGLVAARQLAETGHEVEVLLLWPADQLSADGATNLERFAGSVGEAGPGRLPTALAGSGVIVDAIFGTGFAGAPRDPAATAIEAINGAGAPVVAADIASGVDASSGRVEGAAVDAEATVSFHAGKLGHWIAPGKRHRGDLRVAEIGIPPGGPGEAPGGLLAPGVLGIAPHRGDDSTKFSSGQVLIAGGSRGLSGAVCMSSSASIRAGAGYATVAVPAELEAILEVKLTEVMSIGCPSRDGRLSRDAVEPILGAAGRAAAVVVGPGLGRSDEAFELVGELARRIEAPLVIDADGLNAIAGRLDSLADRPAPTVLTPHAGELGRLLERDSTAISAARLDSAREAARLSGAIVVLKGNDTIVVGPDGRPVVNGLDSPALATAGTGDVLTGVVAALLARGLGPREAAAAAVYAHARAGRLAAERIGAAESVIATDVIAALPRALVAEAPG
ncbi:MAG: NAD(P)H-hydrate dehydratase [Solirubrobacterales bacterium]|nr:NAD(P)H-hydrate dehydratase [Solirubrobacterales bacterium]